MIAYIITEGDSAVELLRRLVSPELLEDVGFVVAGGLSDAVGLARSLLVRRRTPLALVIDSDTTAPEFIQERRQSTEEVVTMVAGKVPVKVLMAVPTIEAVLFRDPSILSRALGQPIPPETLELARTRPSEALARILAAPGKSRALAAILDAVPTEDMQTVRGAEIVRGLEEFLRRVREPASAA